MVGKLVGLHKLLMSYKRAEPF